MNFDHSFVFILFFYYKRKETQLYLFINVRSVCFVYKSYLYIYNQYNYVTALYFLNYFENNKRIKINVEKQHKHNNFTFSKCFKGDRLYLSD